MDPREGLFNTVPFLECFPNFGLSFEISGETYTTLQEYLENNNHKDQLDEYYETSM
jgi:hypothetical protein